jgi:hypothetical protein
MANKGIQQKTGRKKKQSWEAKELSDINKYWVRPWGSKEGKRQTAKRST